MNDFEATLKRIESTVAKLDGKVERLLVGDNSGPGLIARVTKVEDRQGLLAWLCGWIVASVAALAVWMGLKH